MIGGGLYLFESTASVVQVRNNTAIDSGGGIHASSESEIINCSISNNVAGSLGGGVYSFESTINDSFIVGNTSLTNEGGGLCMGNNAVASNCVIRGNVTGDEGGGVYLFESTILNSIIEGNNSASDGGGACGSFRSAVISCIISSNRADNNGGGVFLFDSAIRNSLIAGNRSGAEGGGLCMVNGATMESSTVVGNSSGTDVGGGIFVPTDDNGITNSIIYFNQDNDILVDLFQELSLAYSCWGVLSGTASGSGTITNNPLFINAGSGYGTNLVAGDYRLQASSPCVDTGTNQAWMVGAQDLAGTNRILNGIVNMGAYEGTSAAKTPQTITFPAIANQAVTSRVGLAATASSGLPVTFSVASGSASISGGTNLTFSAAGTVTIRASQAGNATYDPAPNVDRSFYAVGNTFSLRAVALRTNVVLRWTDPYSVGFSNQTVLLRFSTVSYPAATNNGTEIFRNTNQVYTHTGLTPGQPYYYTVWCSHDGVTFVPPPYDEPPTVTNGPVTVFWFSTLGETAYWHLDTNGVLNESGTVQETPVDPAAWIFGGVADINKDNRPEIFWSPTNAVMKTWFLDENYQYSSNATLYGSQCPREYQFRCSGDASGDGFPDLFYQDVYFGYIDSWHVRPNGTLLIAQPTYASSINRSLQLRDCGDVNGDGRVELFFQNTNDGTTATWFMDTNGQQTAMLTMYTNVVSNGWTMVCAGDVSGDGNSEIFWQHTNGTASIWFLNTNGFRTNGYPMTSTPVADGWRMVDKADVNGDGRVELLWQNTDGSTMVWFLNPDGTFARQQEMSSTPMPSKWRMMGAFTAQTIVTGPP